MQKYLGKVEKYQALKKKSWAHYLWFLKLNISVNIHCCIFLHFTQFNWSREEIWYSYSLFKLSSSANIECWEWIMKGLFPCSDWCFEIKLHKMYQNAINILTHGYGCNIDSFFLLVFNHRQKDLKYNIAFSSSFYLVILISLFRLFWRQVFLGNWLWEKGNWLDISKPQHF